MRIAASLLIGAALLLAACGVAAPTSPVISATPLPSAVVETAPTPAPTSPRTPTSPPTQATTPAPTLGSTVTAAPATAPVLVGASDITDCHDDAGATADLIAALPDAIVQTFGDNEQADSPTLARYQQCFGPTWGQFLARLHPAEGNHDGASGGAYFQYFGAAAGSNPQGWYSYDIGSWHIVVLNTECPGGCGRGSPQETWLKTDLAAHAGAQIGAVIHKPVFSSGNLHGNDSTGAAFWSDLVASRACFVLDGHDHDYERFAPQDAAGNPDPAGPIEFVVGTGGYGQRGFGSVQANSVVRHSGTFGVLKLTLGTTGFDWAFVPVAGETWTDTGSASCPR